VSTTIVLVRHGEAATDGCCAGVRFDPPLTREGRAQAQRARQRSDAVLGASPALVVASPARRARQTAAVWTHEPLIEPRLAERDWGEWEGRPWAQLWAEAPAGVTEDVGSYLAFTPPGAEPMADVRARAARALVALAEGPAATVVAVTHAGPLRLAAGHLCGLDAADAFALGAPHAGGLVLTRAARGWHMTTLEAHSCLAADVPPSSSGPCR